jgi:hypothetical protein
MPASSAPRCPPGCQGYLLPEYHDGYWLGLNASGPYTSFWPLDVCLRPPLYRNWGFVQPVYNATHNISASARPDNFTGGRTAPRGDAGAAAAGEVPRWPTHPPCHVQTPGAQALLAVRCGC